MNKGSGLYCVECLIEIQFYEDQNDGLCNPCRKHLAEGGEPREHSIVNEIPKKNKKGLTSDIPEIYLG
jgi:hypothetical protein